MKCLPSAEVLRELLEYDSETGELRWRERSPKVFSNGRKKSAADKAKSWNARYAGSPALCTISGGYFGGDLFGRSVKAHRVIFKMVRGYDPEEVDHIDHDRFNNRLKNLRAATKLENGRNQSIPKNNKSGVMGVRWAKHAHAWVAYIRQPGGKIIYLGCFQDINEAAAARRSAAMRLGYHPNHGVPAP